MQPVVPDTRKGIQLRNPICDTGKIPEDQEKEEDEEREEKREREELCGSSPTS